MDDKKAIQDAYAGVLEQLFKVLFAGYTQANDDPQVQKHALAAFEAGLALARKAQADALAAL